MSPDERNALSALGHWEIGGRAEELPDARLRYYAKASVITALHEKGWINGPIGFDRKWALSAPGSVALAEAGGCLQPKRRT